MDGLAGAAVVGGIAYVSVTGAILKVVLSTGTVTILAGTPGVTGCPLSLPGQIATDGTSLYVADNDSSCGYVTVVSIANGAITSIGSGRGYDAIAFNAPDGYLYAISNTIYHGTVYRISLGGTVSTVATLTNRAWAIAADDSTYVWVTESNSGGFQLDRIDLSTGAVDHFLQPNGGSIGSLGQMLSSGSYLYTPTPSLNAIERITKPTGTTATVDWIAGTPTGGYADGTGTDAWFSTVFGLATDGTNLYAADKLNGSIRQIAPGTSLPSAQTPNATATVDVYPGKVSLLSSDPLLAGGIAGMVIVPQIVNQVPVNMTYLSVPGEILQYNPSTGALVTFVGSSTPGCVLGTDPAAVRFSSQLGQIDSDGYYLYVTDLGCAPQTPGQIDRVSLATKATSLLSSLNVSSVAVGPDGDLYALRNGNDHPGIYQLNRVDGSSTTPDTPWATYTQGGSGISVAADNQYVWVSETVAHCFGDQLDRFKIADGTEITFSPPSCDSGMTGGGQLASAGDYLYASSYGANGVERISKATGAVGVLAGGSSGQSVGEWSNAKFSAVRAVATDGQNLMFLTSAAWTIGGM